MAASSNTQEIDWQALKTLVFGQGLKDHVLRRWLQPFKFSSKEPAALVQDEGGPCAVLAPLQAFLLKTCLQKSIPCLSSLSDESVKLLLAGALSEILDQCCSAPTLGECGAVLQKRLLVARVHRDVSDMLEEAGHQSITKKIRIDESSSAAGSGSAMVDFDLLHTCLMVESFPSAKELREYLEDNFDAVFGTNYDILSVLYSVVLTKGAEAVMTERQDVDEPLIDPVHGHGSQALINLLLTGSATPNVFDGEKDLCGLKLQGIQNQSSVGFLSYLECLRYLEVGRHLKQPLWPVWVLGSETHLTVVFSRNSNLVTPLTARQLASDKFSSHDPDSSGFIPSSKLGEVMADLELFAEQSYVDLMLPKLDPDDLGIVLKRAFLEEFFPEEAGDARSPDTFTIFHYNGLDRRKDSNSGVSFVKGEAVVLEGVSGTSSSNAILQTLQTKWVNLAIDWDGGVEPSIN